MSAKTNDDVTVGLAKSLLESSRNNHNLDSSQSSLNQDEPKFGGSSEKNMIYSEVEASKH